MLKRFFYISRNKKVLLKVLGRYTKKTKGKEMTITNKDTFLAQRVETKVRVYLSILYLTPTILYCNKKIKTAQTKIYLITIKEENSNIVKSLHIKSSMYINRLGKKNKVGLTVINFFSLSY